MSGGPTDLSLLDTKEYEKVAKLIGDKAARDILGRGDVELKDLIALNSVEIQKATADVKSNPKYKTALEVISDLNGGLRESVKPLKLVVALATLVLRMRAP